MCTTTASPCTASPGTPAPPPPATPGQPSPLPPCSPSPTTTARPRPDWAARLIAAHREAPGRMVGGFTVNALTADPRAEASQRLIDCLYHRLNPNPRDASFLTSNNLLLAAADFERSGGFDADYPLPGGEDRAVLPYMEAARRTDHTRSRRHRRPLPRPDPATVPSPALQLRPRLPAIPCEPIPRARHRRLRPGRAGLRAQTHQPPAAGSSQSVRCRSACTPQACCCCRRSPPLPAPSLPLPRATERRSDPVNRFPVTARVRRDPHLSPTGDAASRLRLGVAADDR